MWLAIRFVSALCILCLTISSALAIDWPEFRGPTRQGVSTAKNVPLTWSESESIVWKVPIRGQGWSSPVVAGRYLFYTAAVPSGDEQQGNYDLSLIALDAQTGAPLWETVVFREAGALAPKIHSKNSHASPTPLVAEGKIYVHFGHMGTACLDPAGKVVWRNAELNFNPVHGNGGSPILAGDKLIFSCDGDKNPMAVALDKKTGKIAWKTPRPNDPPKTFAFCTPLAISVAGRTQVIFPCAGSICAYDPIDGKEIWHVNHGGYSVIPRPVFGNGLVYCSTSYDSPQVMAIRPDGVGDVTETHVEWTQKRGAPHTPSMILDGDELYMVSDGGVASCVDAKTGKQVWQQRLGGAFSASIVLAEGRLYLQDEDGACHVLEKGRTFKKLAENKLPERTLASYAVVDGAILLRGDKHLYRIQANAK